MLFLYTDFAIADPYVGQVKAKLLAAAPGVPVVDLLHEAPAFDIQASAHLLAALCLHLPVPSTTLAVVDPGVGGARRAIVLAADGRVFIAPDNGLLSVLAARAATSSVQEVVWRPPSMSRSFHGRDLFAPVAAALATGNVPNAWLRPVAGLDVYLDSGDLPRVIYVDHYGNAMTGLRGEALDQGRCVRIGGLEVPYAGVFDDVPESDLFWYVNSIGLVEVAANRAHAASKLGIGVGTAVEPG